MQTWQIINVWQAVLIINHWEVVWIFRLCFVLPAKRLYITQYKILPIFFFGFSKWYFNSNWKKRFFCCSQNLKSNFSQCIESVCSCCHCKCVDAQFDVRSRLLSQYASNRYIWGKVGVCSECTLHMQPLLFGWSVLLLKWVNGPRQFKTNCLKIVANFVILFFFIIKMRVKLQLVACNMWICNDFHKKRPPCEIVWRILLPQPNTHTHSQFTWLLNVPG